VALDVATGRPLSMLRAAAGGYWYNAWLFGLHGWLGDDTVLIQTEAWLLAWTPSTGAIERVAEIADYDLGWRPTPSSDRRSRVADQADSP
jgi:hypothetical protein